MGQLNRVLTYLICILCFTGVILSSCGETDSSHSVNEMPSTFNLPNDPDEIAKAYLTSHGIDLSSVQGKSYAGDYLPFGIGYRWRYDGSATTSTRGSSTMQFPGEPADPSDFFSATSSMKGITQEIETAINDLMTRVVKK